MFLRWWRWICALKWNWKYYLTPAIRYVVITKIPRPQDDGNCYDTFLVEKLQQGDLIWVEGEIEDLKPGQYRRARLPVFYLGELLVVNRIEREIASGGRKPDKWWVEYETFWWLRKALKRSNEVLSEENPKYLPSLDDAIDAYSRS